MYGGSQYRKYKSPPRITGRLEKFTGTLGSDRGAPQNRYDVLEDAGRRHVAMKLRKKSHFCPSCAKLKVAPHKPSAALPKRCLSRRCHSDRTVSLRVAPHRREGRPNRNVRGTSSSRPQQYGETRHRSADGIGLTQSTCHRSRTVPRIYKAIQASLNQLTLEPRTGRRAPNRLWIIPATACMPSGLGCAVTTTELVGPNDFEGPILMRAGFVHIPYPAAMLGASTAGWHCWSSDRADHPHTPGHRTSQCEGHLGVRGIEPLPPCHTKVELRAPNRFSRLAAGSVAVQDVSSWRHRGSWMMSCGR